MTAPAGDATPACTVCGTRSAPEESRLAWSLQVGARGEQWLCPACTRAHVRSIEGRLDEAWW